MVAQGESEVGSLREHGRRLARRIVLPALVALLALAFAASASQARVAAFPVRAERAYLRRL